MHMVKIFTYILILSVCVSHAFQKSDDLILNNGFESTSYHHWLFRGNCEISSEISHSGDNAVKISNLNSDKNYAYQYLKNKTKEFTAIVWLYPKGEEYYTSIKFVANWDKFSLDNILSLDFTSDSLWISSIKQSITVKNSLSSDIWNKVEINTDSSGIVKNIFINEKFISRIISDELIPVNALILGSINKSQGEVFYDDISIISKIPDVIVSKDHFSLIQISTGRNFVGFTYGAGLSYGFDNNLITIRFIGADEINIQLIGAHPYENDYPEEESRDIAILYGRYIVTKNALISASLGAGYLGGIKRGNNISGHEFKKIQINTISFPIELQFIGFLSKNYGFIFTAYANVNNQESILGGQLGIYWKL